ncbi:MAG: HAD-IA family hydrolase [Candidatus Omnitrophica bacterium]|nr:HAD-IA family hydrolase [Candidatus Omnitrophota bacterium]
MQHTKTPYRKHLFVCANQREGEQTCCARGGGLAIRDALKRYVTEHGLNGVVRVSSSGCQGLCEEGPNVMVFPDNYWYHHVQPDDMEAIIHAHLAPLVTVPGGPGPPGTEERPLIRAILFDLGNTLLPFDHLRAARALAPFARQTPEALYQSFFDSAIQQEHDEGRLSGLEFYERVRREYDLTCTYEQFIPRWNDIFWENAEVAALVRRLKGSYRLVGISNTNRLHFEDARARYPVVREIETWMLSYEVGARKPEAAIYRRAIEAAGVPPQEIVYVDDRLDLVEAGRALGLQAHLFINARRLATQLAAAGVTL